MKKQATQPLGFLLLLGTSLCSASPFLSDNFDSYSDGLLSGQGSWTRAPSTDDPATQPAVSSGSVFFDWPSTAAVNSATNRLVASEDQLATGWLYVAFDLRVSVAPTTDVTGLDSLRPGFFALRNSAGSANRGRIGINPGSLADTFTLGVSSGSQLQSSYNFAGSDLNLNTDYTVVLGYNIDTTAAQIWINPADQTALPVASAAGSNSVQSIRRITLGIDNNDGAGGFSNMGQFTLDNLMSATTLGEVGVAVPEPSTYALIFGGIAVGFILLRRRTR